MSYDLFFYTSKKQPVSWERIATYLTDHIGVGEYGQWVYENNDTGVYFILEKTSSTDEVDPIVFDGFDSAELGFILNFIRPTFFGIEAFLFVEQITKDLGLYVLNPQQDFEELTQPAKEVLFENWNRTNAWAFKDNMDEEAVYVDRDVSTTVWNYNFNRKRLQEEVGENYYVSRMFIFQRTADKKAVTVSMWTEHIPNILPDTDYYYLGREYKKLFKNIKDSVLLSKEEFNRILGPFFEPYYFSNSKIIHPDKAASIKKLYNSITSELDFNRDLKHVAIENIYDVEKLG